MQAACAKAQEQLAELYEKALDEVGEDNAAIFEIHQMMLDDDYLDAVKSILVTQGATAEYAVTTTGENFSAAFAAMEDEYMRARRGAPGHHGGEAGRRPEAAGPAPEPKEKPNITLDGKEIKVCANIGNAGDVGLVLQNDAQGIGLFRSEFIYLDSQDYPSEDQQFMLYKRVVETMAGKKVIIRTLDIGADKQADYFELDKEENPAQVVLSPAVGFRAEGQIMLGSGEGLPINDGLMSALYPNPLVLGNINEDLRLIADFFAASPDHGACVHLFAMAFQGPLEDLVDYLGGFGVDDDGVFIGGVLLVAVDGKSADILALPALPK